jgi:short-subunit dehydrogenase
VNLAELKVVAITGSSSGIGAALATHLASPERVIGMVARDRGRLEEVAAVCRARGATCVIAASDIESPATGSFLRRFHHEQPIDLLVLNAGILDGRRRNEDIEHGAVAAQVLNTNLLATVSNLHSVLPQMRERGRGTIVLVSSLAAFVPLADAPAYSASKAGLVSYGLALRQVVEPYGIRVIVACPGFVSTPMGGVHIGNRPGEISADRAARTILGAVRSNKGLVGFPTSAYWLSRAALLVPERWRYHFGKKTRFHCLPKDRE